MIEPPGSPKGKPQPPQAQRPTPAEKAQREKVQKQLDEALADSFPASDPVSIVTSNEEEDWGEPESQ
jgi:hypothetical protein